MRESKPQSSDDQRIAIEAQRVSESLLKREKAAGRYIIQKELGRGAMGIVHFVEDQDLKRITAMKVITPQFIEMEKRFTSFITEARLTAQLEHPNIVPIHHIGIEEGTGLPFYTMKLVEGEPLQKIIEKLEEEDPAYIKKFNRNELLNIFRSVCYAVSYAHSRGVIHRDIKPENIMVGHFGEVLMMDWGLAKQLNSMDSSSLDISNFLQDQRGELFHVMQTMDGTIKGSPAYISPEQAFGDVEAIDTKTDIFLLGSTLYHIFTHYPPYSGDSIMEVVEKAEKCNFPPPRERNPKCHIPIVLERIILKALAPIKANRYHTVDELIEDIDAFISGSRVSARKMFSVGDKLITAGEMTTESYIIYSGKVEVSRNISGKKIVLATASPGEIIGEMAGITETVSSADVIALEATDTLVITHDLMKEEIQKLPPWLEHIIFSMTKRVRTLMKQVHPLLIEEGAYPIINQLFYIFLSTREKQLSDAYRSSKLKDIIDEISINLGLDRLGIEKILMILVESDMCKLNKENELSIPKMDDLNLFVDYCRVKWEIKGGMKEIKSVHLTPEKESYFRTITRKLHKLFEKK
jgi:serine/threonine-protein kinase